MVQILIRLLDDHMVKILRAQALCRGVVLEQGVRELLTATAKMDTNSTSA
jgi:plasmid stability protein